MTHKNILTKEIPIGLNESEIFEKLNNKTEDNPRSSNLMGPRTRKRHIRIFIDGGNVVHYRYTII